MKVKLLIGLLVISLCFGIISDSFGSGGGGGGHTPPTADLHVYWRHYNDPPVLLVGNQADYLCVGCVDTDGSGIRQYCFDPDGSGNQICPTDENGHIMYVLYWTPQECGQFTATVTVISGAGYPAYDEVLYDVVPPAPVLQSPADGSSCTTSVTLMWSSVSDVNSYQVYFGTANPPVSRIDGNNLTDNYLPVSGLDANRTYYWEVKSVKNSESSYFDNSIWSFTVTPPPTYTISGTVKLNGTGLRGVIMNGLPNSPATDDDGNYSVTVNPDSDQTITVIPSMDGYNFIPPQMVYSGTALDQTAQNYLASKVPLPGRATNPHPADGNTDVSITSILTWTPHPAATSQEVFLGTDSQNPVSKGIKAGTDTNYNPGTLVTGKTYYWRIDEKNDSGTTTGTLWHFMTVPLRAPTDLNSIVVNGAVQLSWIYADPQADHYKVYRSEERGGPYTLLQGNVVNKYYTDNLPTPSTERKLYFYVVTAVDSAGNESPYSNE